MVRLRLHKEMRCVQIKRIDTKKETVHRQPTGSSEEESDGGDHGEHSQPLPPFDPHESHDDHVEDVLGTLAELESDL